MPLHTKQKTIHDAPETVNSASNHSSAPNKIICSLRIPLRTAVIGIFLLLMIGVCVDLSLARLSYHYHIKSSIASIKMAMQADHTIFHPNVPEDRRLCLDRHDCSNFTCEMNALTISSHRQEVLSLIRERHMFAHIVSHLFDGARNVDQSLKLKSLFETKTCESIIASSDRTNIIMDGIAILVTVLAIYLIRLLWHTIRDIIANTRLD